MSAFIRCDRCGRETHEVADKGWHKLWREDLDYCSWKCLANAALAETASRTTVEGERRGDVHQFRDGDGTQLASYVDTKPGLPSDATWYTGLTP